MSDTQKNNKMADERKDEATDPRTLDEIEDDEKLSSDSTQATIPMPDQGSRQSSDDDAGPM
jgi:hypothetical protein